MMLSEKLLKLFCGASVFVMTSAPAVAKLPTKPGDIDVKSGDYISAFKAYVKAGGEAMGLAVCMVLFLVVVVTSMGKFKAAMDGKAPWSDLLGSFAVAAVLLVASIWLLTESASVL